MLGACKTEVSLVKKQEMFFHFIQEEEVVQEETEFDHVLTDQVKVEPTLSYDNEAFIPDLSSSSDDMAEDTKCFQEKTEDDLTDQTPVKMEPTLSHDNEAPIPDLSSSLDDMAEDESTIPLDQENIEMSVLPSTSKERDQTAENLLSSENPDDRNEEENLGDENEEKNLGDGSEVEDSFTTQQLFSFAWQIAKGMNHLAEKDFVHRDLAARNILVGKDNQVKVSDFGLMRQIYEDVYSAKKTKKLPVKWMAPESIQDGVFTIKSDAWSYGILLWEMATMGGAPYPTMSNAQMCRALKSGYRMERPEMCCDEAYELMTECWREDPTARPSFSQLINRLETVMTSDAPYCDVSKHDESSPYYRVPAKDDEDSY